MAGFDKLLAFLAKLTESGTCLDIKYIHPSTFRQSPMQRMDNRGFARLAPVMNLASARYTLAHEYAMQEQTEALSI